MDNQSIISQSLMSITQINNEESSNTNNNLNNSQSDINTSRSSSRSRSNKFGVPNKLIIDGYYYNFKDSLKNNRFSYRCRCKKCATHLTIEKNELDKILYGGSNEITYYLNREHICGDGNENTNNTSKKIVKLTDRDIYLKGKQTVLNSVNKPLYWHVKNIKDSGFNLSVEQILNILRYEREKKFPYDNQFLYNINSITLTLDNIIKNIPFCFGVNKLINNKYNYRKEQYVIFTSNIQMKHFIESSEIYIDINYKVCPKGYQQILTFISHNIKNNTCMPAFINPMTNKSKMAYNYIFRSILSIINDNKYNYDVKNKIIICDFEYNLRKAIKENFQDCKIKGAYFHFVKKLWLKAKKFGLIEKEIMEITNIVLFAMKLIVLIKKENLEKYLREISEFTQKYFLEDENSDKISKKLDNFKNFEKYFMEIWYPCEYINFEKISGKEWLLRTNNICEKYHNALSFSTEYFFPKMASLAKNLKNLIKEYYLQCTPLNKLDDKNTNIEDMEFILVSEKNCFEEIFDFVSDYHKNFQKEISIFDLAKIDNDFKSKINKSNYTDLKCIFGLTCISGPENDNDFCCNQYNFEEIEKILPKKENIGNLRHKDIEFLIDIDKEENCGNEDKDSKKDKKYYFNVHKKFDELYMFKNIRKYKKNKDKKNMKVILNEERKNKENNMSYNIFEGMEIE